MTQFQKISQKQYDIDMQSCPTPYDELKLPKRATIGSAGYDFFSPVDFELKPGETIKIPTGIRVILPNDKFLMIVPRSGLGFKYRLQLDNTVGVIDSDYANSDNEGHIWIKVTNNSKIDYEKDAHGCILPTYPSSQVLFIKQGQAIAQGIILPFFKVDDDNTDGIRNGGLGSTTKKEQYGKQ